MNVIDVIMEAPDLPHLEKRIVVIDYGKDPAEVLTNCLTCNRLTSELESEGIMCMECFRRWSIKRAKEFILSY